MKNLFLVSLFITLNVSFIFLQIHKNSLFVQQEYQRQYHEKKRIELTNRKNDLTQRLYTLQSKNHVKQYATDKLKMRPLELSQVKKFPTS